MNKSMIFLKLKQELKFKPVNQTKMMQKCMQCVQVD